MNYGQDAVWQERNRANPELSLSNIENYPQLVNAVARFTNPQIAPGSLGASGSGELSTSGLAV
jgi:hypothetical protein